MAEISAEEEMALLRSPITISYLPVITILTFFVSSKTNPDSDPGLTLALTTNLNLNLNPKWNKFVFQSFIHRFSLLFS